MERTTISLPEDLLKRLRVIASRRERPWPLSSGRPRRKRQPHLAVARAVWGWAPPGALRHRAAGRRGAPRAAVVALILDTGPLYASLDRSDAAHPECRGLIEQAEEALIIPTPVLVEVDYWIHQRLHAAVLVALLTT